MKALFAVAVLAISILLSQTARAEICVIVHPENEISHLSQKQVIDYYMGRLQFFPNGQKAIPLDQSMSSPERKQFYLKLVGKTIPQINAYWARLLFTGRATPPTSIQTREEIINTVLNNKSAIGYINSDEVPNSVKIVAYVK